MTLHIIYGDVSNGDIPFALFYQTSKSNAKACTSTVHVCTLPAETSKLTKRIIRQLKNSKRASSTKTRMRLFDFDICQV